MPVLALEPCPPALPSDAPAHSAWQRVLAAAVSVPDAGALLVECATCDDADRLLAAAIGCRSGSITTTASGITCATVAKEQNELKEISCLNHCGHL